MIVDWQNEPIKGALLHIDLKRIAMDKMMTVSVPIQLVGVPVGVKAQGGILEHVLREVEIECLPGDIPSHLDVDVSGLEMNQSIHVSDLPHSGSIKFLGDEDATVAHVTAIREEVVGARGSGCRGNAGRTRSRQEGQGRDGCRCCRLPMRRQMPRATRARSKEDRC